MKHNRNRFWAGLTALAVFLAGLTGCSTTDPGADVTYIITTDAGAAPFEFWESDREFAGISADILEAISDEMGLKYNLQPLGLEAATKALEAGEADAVLAVRLPVGGEGQENYLFSRPFYLSHAVMAVPAESSVSGFADLAGLTVSVVQGSDAAAFAESIQEKYGFILQYAEDISQLCNDVGAGNAAACIGEAATLSYACKYRIGLQVVTDLEDYREEGGETSSHAMAVLTTSEKGHALLSTFNAGLETITKSGKLEDIYEDYGIRYGDGR